MAGVLAFDNQIDASDCVLVRIGSGTDVTPIANLKRRQLARVWRVAAAGDGITDTGLRATFTTSRRLRQISILNFPYAAVLASLSYAVRVRVLNGGGGVLLDEYRLPPYISGAYSEPPNVHFTLEQELVGARVIEVTWPHGMGTDFEIGRLWASRALVFPDGYDASWRTDWTSDGRITRSRGGSAYERAAPKYRVTTFANSSVDAALVLPAASWSVPPLTLKGLGAKVGNTGEVLAILRSDEVIDSQETGIYGSLESSVSYEHIDADTYSVSFKHIEER